MVDMDFKHVQVHTHSKSSCVHKKLDSNRSKACPTRLRLSMMIMYLKFDSVFSEIRVYDIG